MKTIIKGTKVNLSVIGKEDLAELYQLRYGEDDPEWKKWDAPYYEHRRPEYVSFEERELQELETDEAYGVHSQLIISVGDEIIGTILYYWEHEPTRWLEIGIAIYSPKHWNGGYGTEALRLYIDYLFQELEIGRVGLTTWSGNERMVAAAEKAGMSLEGRMRKCRYYNGHYYDSIRMGMIREEWEAKKIPMGGKALDRTSLGKN